MHSCEWQPRVIDEVVLLFKISLQETAYRIVMEYYCETERLLSTVVSSAATSMFSYQELE